jgi:hypothetical protein
MLPGSSGPIIEGFRFPLPCGFRIVLEGWVTVGGAGSLVALSEATSLEFRSEVWADEDHVIKLALERLLSGMQRHLAGI